MQKKLITLVFVSILTMTFGSGCFSYGERTEQQDVTPQSYEEHSSVPVLMLPPSPTTQPLVPFQPTSNPALGTPITQAPAPVASPVIGYATHSRAFKGQGIHFLNVVKALRVMSPFGESAGAVIEDAAKKPATISAGDTPMISMGSDGSFKVGKGEDVKVVGETTGGSILSQIVTKVKDWGLIILVVIGAIILLPLIFPVLSPIFSLIWSIISGIWTWIKSAASAAATHIQAAIPVVEAEAATAAGKVVSEWRSLTTSAPTPVVTSATAAPVPTVTTSVPVSPTVPTSFPAVPSTTPVVDPTALTKPLNVQ